MASDYPTSIDPELATLRDDIDTFRSNGEKHIADMAIAVQTLMGTGFTDLTALGGGAPKYGNLAQMILSLSRVATGEESITWNPSSGAEANGSPITTIFFPTNRFTITPFLFIQTLVAEQYASGSANGYRMSKLYAVNPTRHSFSVSGSGALAGLAVSSGSGVSVKFHWVAFEPPFGYVDGDGEEG
tara:strand:- start:245 stop:802 length:558 start_codon:yes stop_codon:yes gene_type:complete